MPERPVDPVFWEHPQVRSALARRDIGRVYRLLCAEGMTQAQIAACTGQRQGEVSAIVAGRPVQTVPLLERIAAGLGIPPGFLGLAYCDTPTYGDPSRTASIGDEVDDEVRRRAFLAAASAAVVGRPVLGEVLALADPAADPALPTRLVTADVLALRDLTTRFRELGRAFGGMFDALGPIAARADRLLNASGTAQVEHALRQALGDLHELAGWTAYDVGLANRTRYHYDRALRLAAEINDPLRMISAVQHAAISDREDGAPDSALRLYQLATAKLLRMPAADHRVPVKQAWLHVQMARCYTLLERPTTPAKNSLPPTTYPNPTTTSNAPT